MSLVKTEEIGGAELRVWASLGLEKVKELVSISVIFHLYQNACITSIGALN